jgi:hypothetical protein
MIYEFRTYTLKVGSVAEVEKRFGEAYEYRKKYSPLAAFLHTEVGPLNQIVHIWGYNDLAERAKVRAEASKEANWPPKIQEFILHMESEILNPFPFVPDIKPGKQGPIFEMRCYGIKAGTAPDLTNRWQSRIDERAKLSPIITAGLVEFGQANRFIHVWAYKSMDERLAIREQARKAGVWPPPGGGDTLHTQENKILMPSAFSPLQ